MGPEKNTILGLAAASLLAATTSCIFRTNEAESADTAARQKPDAGAAMPVAEAGAEMPEVTPDFKLGVIMGIVQTKMDEMLDISKDEKKWIMPACFVENTPEATFRGQNYKHCVTPKGEYSDSELRKLIQLENGCIAQTLISEGNVSVAMERANQQVMEITKVHDCTKQVGTIVDAVRKDPNFKRVPILPPVRTWEGVGHFLTTKRQDATKWEGLVREKTDKKDVTDDVHIADILKKNFCTGLTNYPDAAKIPGKITDEQKRFDDKSEKEVNMCVEKPPKSIPVLRVTKTGQESHVTPTQVVVMDPVAACNEYTFAISNQKHEIEALQATRTANEASCWEAAGRFLGATDKKKK